MKKTRVPSPLIILAIAGLVWGGCATKVTRTELDKKVDLSGRWNDTDARLVSEEMISDCLAKPWLDAFIMKNGRQPVVIVGTVRNRTGEHIDSRLFTSSLERALINSGKIRFVAMKGDREEIREEKEDQALHAAQTTRKLPDQETGADYMVQGTINSVKDEVEGKYAVLYQANLELVDLTTNEKVWIGQQEIKKVVSRRVFGW